ncbi:hypothetical protein GCM10011376_39690 [Nocardioides flavus (ex Wang et al. 2016)]|uniref:Uncharacterized protein n=1 Tax=Nocardioides flavus (ex Wang et al. 2016) TaxID=2058780 RepID=A0ABQ3HRV6_9ACTN|nr:hypothetical protein [Nocardioides flavus (ex Wang et al. 2016)]GHE19359.1 hypothetical protein GCM10011376_39690 [Nocardioides flavus (ex Wang et al. 2016)]
MSPLWRRTPTPAVDVGAGERVLASATATDGTVLAGTRDAFYLVRDGETRRVPWEQVEAAGWDRDTDSFRLSEVGTWGEQRPVHIVTLAEPGRLLELVHERVTASIVLQRHVEVGRRRGLRVIARRAPAGAGSVHWVYEYDEGVDPADPAVRSAAREALDLARRDVGMP